MQEEKGEWVSKKSEINGSEHSETKNHNVLVSGKKPLMMINSESFYQRLSEFFESSGLSLVFNDRGKVLDLYLFYKEVTQRGGFHQVTRDRKWDEVACALKLEGSNLKLISQLQKLYLTLLVQFDQIFSYRNPDKPSKENSSGLKRKYSDSLTFMSTDIQDAQTGKVKCIDNSCSILEGSGAAEQKIPLLMPSENKPVNKKPGAPQGWRNCYQFFLNVECARLKKIHGESPNGKSFRDMAIDAWRHLSLKERQPYIELSKKDKERYCKEMGNYIDQQKSQCNSTTGDYHVSSQPDAESFLVLDQSMIDLASEMMKTTPSDESISDINWYDFNG